MVTYPHPFWLVSGKNAELVEVAPEDDVHLMVTLWDMKTETIIPTDIGLSIEIRQNGEIVDSRTPWTMLSQTMGAHYGDNVPLAGEGTYTIEVTVPPVPTRLTGDLHGRFDSRESVTFEFTFDGAFLEEVIEAIHYLDPDEWGTLGALEPDMHDHHGHDHDGHDHGHHIPFSHLPPVDELPGAHQGTGSSHDAEIPVTLVEESRRFSVETPYLLVSPRTPYNRVPLPEMHIAVDLLRDDEVVTSVNLGQTIDHEIGLHYGAAIPEIETGDRAEIQFNSPPQVSRHQGYETAFVDMSPVMVELER